MRRNSTIVGWVRVGALTVAAACPQLARAGCEAAPGPQPPTVDVLTFNAWGLPAPVSRDRAGRFSAISDYLGGEDYDVVGLQEVWRGSLGLLRLDHLLLPPGGAGGQGAPDSGLGLVTAHDASSPQLDVFAQARGLDALKRKGLMHAVVDVPGVGDVLVAVTHLQSGGGEASARVRRAQTDQVLGWLADHDGPAVLMGDFNFYADSAEDRHTRRRVGDAGWTDAAEAAGATAGTYVGLSERFDRVFVRGSREHCWVTRSAEVIGYDEDPSTANPRFLSDHRPVRVALAVGEPTLTVE